MIMPMKRLLEGSWDPFRELQSLERELSHYLGGARPVGEFPAVNLWADEQGVVLTAEAPGLAPEDLSLTVQEEHLVLEGTPRASNQNETGKALREERIQRPFNRRIRLPYAVEAEGVRAILKNGLLRVELPRRESTRPRRIAVEIA